MLDGRVGMPPRSIVAGLARDGTRQGPVVVCTAESQRDHPRRPAGGMGTVKPDERKGSASMNTDRDEQLRRRAYRIWESEGRPDGMEAEHWARAERELADEVAGPTAMPAALSRRKATPAEKPAAAAAPVKKKAPLAAPKAAPRKKKD